MTEITVTEAELVDAFTEWERRFREEPERFEAEAVRLLKSSAEEYGSSCAPYLLWLLAGCPEEEGDGGLRPGPSAEEILEEQSRAAGG